MFLLHELQKIHEIINSNISSLRLIGLAGIIEIIRDILIEISLFKIMFY